MVTEVLQSTSLYKLLIEPPLAVTIEELRATWRVTTLRVITRKCPDFDFWPELSVRIRGAFGQALHDKSAEYSRRGAELFSVYHGIFEHQSWLPAQHEVAKPFTIRAWQEADVCIVELRLYGIADQWLEPAAECLIEALERGIAIKSERSFRVAMPVLDVFQQTVSTLEPIESARSAILRFRSPVAIRRDGNHIYSARAILKSVIKRVESLAPWQIARLQCPRTELFAAIDQLDIDDRDLLPYRWQRHSKNSGDTAIPVGGQLGDLRVNGDLAPLLDYLQITQTCNTGSHAALGLGWFELILYP